MESRSAVIPSSFDEQRSGAAPNVGQPINQESVATLAYSLWQARGCPAGTANDDWAEAEKQLMQPKTHAAKAGE